MMFIIFYKVLFGVIFEKYSLPRAALCLPNILVWFINVAIFNQCGACIGIGMNISRNRYIIKLEKKKKRLLWNLWRNSSISIAEINKAFKNIVQKLTMPSQS